MSLSRCSMASVEKMRDCAVPLRRSCLPKASPNQNNGAQDGPLAIRSKRSLIRDVFISAAKTWSFITTSRAHEGGVPEICHHLLPNLLGYGYWLSVWQHSEVDCTPSLSSLSSSLAVTLSPRLAVLLGSSPAPLGHVHSQWSSLHCSPHFLLSACKEEITRAPTEQSSDGVRAEMGVSSESRDGCGQRTSRLGVAVESWPKRKPCGYWSLHKKLSVASLRLQCAYRGRLAVMGMGAENQSTLAWWQKERILPKQEKLSALRFCIWHSKSSSACFRCRCWHIGVWC